MDDKAHVALIGPMGAGKSSVGRLLAERLGRPFVDLDRVIETRAGADIALIFDLEGESGFRRREHEALAQVLAGSGQVVACGGGIVLDPDNRRLLAERAFVILLSVTVEQQLARLQRDRRRPLLQTDDRRARLETLARERAPLYAATADLTWSADTGKAAWVAQQLAERIRERT